jgi:hypothetical protein
MTLTQLGFEILGTISLYLEAQQVSLLTLSCKQALLLNSELQWKARGQGSWVELTLHSYFRFAKWRAACEAASIFRGLCTVSASLGHAPPPALPLRSPFAVRVAAIDRTVEALQRAVSMTDSNATVSWSGTLHLAAFFLIALKQIPQFRRGGAACTDDSRDLTAMRSEVPVLMHGALLFFRDAIPSVQQQQLQHQGFARRWITGPAVLICRTISFFRIIARPLLRRCVDLLRHSHPSTQDPIRNAAGLLITRAVESSRAFATLVPFVSSDIAAIVGSPTAPDRVPLEFMELAVRSALQQEVGVYSGDGLWECLERIVLNPISCGGVSISGERPDAKSLAANAWMSWQTGLSALPLDQAEACVVAAFKCLFEDHGTAFKRTRASTTLLTPLLPRDVELAEPTAKPRALSLVDGDYSGVFSPFSPPPSEWQAPRVFLPKGQQRHLADPHSPESKPFPESEHWSSWAINGAKRVASGLFSAVSPCDLVVFALPDELSPCRVFVQDLLHRETGCVCA